MPAIVIHGDRDDTVPYSCGQQAVAQWLLTGGLVLDRAVPSRPAAVELLLAHGADPSAKDNDGKTAVDLAASDVVREQLTATAR